MLNKPTPSWMLEQISRDLSFCKNNLSTQFLDTLFENETLCLVRVRVKNGTMTVEKSKSAEAHCVPDQILPHFFTLQTLAPLPDFDLVFTAHDTLSPQNTGTSWPIFVITKNKYANEYILFPDWFALRGYEGEKAEVLAGKKKYPWKSKRKILFFRGKDSGIPDVSKWESYPRPQLVALSVKYPQLIDAKFSDLFYSPMLETAKKNGWMGQFVSMKKHPRYRYVMDIDGNCAATPRLPLLMHTQSTIFKNMTPSIQWFYGRLKPYVHFIPVAEDLSDLLLQLQWAHNHDKECKKVAKNAALLAEEIFTQESIYLYLYRLLEEYAKLQNSKITTASK